MDIEQKTVTLPLDGNLQAKVDALVAEGWNLLPGALPVVVYQLVRVNLDQVPGGLGKLTIDESKILIVPGTDRKQ